MNTFFKYFGGKWKAAPYYPGPLYRKIIEPFAGAAGYSVRHYHHEVVLYDVDPVIAGLWAYLIRSSSEDILQLPIDVQHVDDLKVCQEAKWLIGFWLNSGTSSPMKSPSKWARDDPKNSGFWCNATKRRIARQVRKIKHWKIHHKSYLDVPDEKATWFIDPPYQGPSGKYYRCRFDDYKRLGDWCKNRKGQVTVCEQEGADWLPFQQFRTIGAAGGYRGKPYSKEVIWSNIQYGFMGFV